MNATPDFDGMASALEATGKYRVLRKLPNLVYSTDPSEIEEKAYKAVVLDTETTGLDTKTCKIIEIALLEIFYAPDSCRLLGIGRGYTEFNDPDEPLSDDVKRVTGITDEIVKGQNIDWAKVDDILAGASVIIAHNAGFDRPILERYSSTVASRKWACSNAEIDWKAEGSPSTSLPVIAWFLGWFYDAHRAWSDVSALTQLLFQRCGTGQPMYFRRLIESARRTSYRVYATGSPFEKKDAIKARGYNWDADRKVWFKDIRDNTHANGELSPLDLELMWLREHGGARPDFKEMTAKDRYK